MKELDTLEHMGFVVALAMESEHPDGYSPSQLVEAIAEEAGKHLEVSTFEAQTLARAVEVEGYRWFIEWRTPCRTA